MNRLMSIIGLGAVISLLHIAGCAYPTVTQEYSNRIESVAILVNHQGEHLKIMDRTTGMGTPNVHSQAGALSALAMATRGGAAMQNRISKSLGGSPNPLRAALVGFKIDDTVYENLEKRLSKKYRVVDGRNLRVRDDHDDSEPPSQENRYKSYLGLFNLKDVDAFIKIDYVYGLTAYIGEPASTAIEANFEVWDVPANRKLLPFKQIYSDHYFKCVHKISEYVDNDAVLFKEEIGLAADSIALQVVSIFGMDIEEAESRRVKDTLRASSLTCDEPYALSQDCSHDSVAERLIEVNGRRIRLAGSSDGKVVLVMDGKYYSNNAKLALSLGISDKGTDEALKSVHMVESFLSNHDVNIIKKWKLISYGSVQGFILELDKDGYSMLKGNTVGKSAKKQ